MAVLNELFSALDSIGEINKTVDVQIGDRKLSYNPDLWRLIDVPEQYRFESQYDKSIQYIGPIVDGKVIQEFPWIKEPISMYKTYANLHGLTKSPRIPMRHTYRVFEGCTDIDTIFEQRWYEPYGGCGGCAHGGLYDGVISDKLIDLGSITINGIIDWLGLDPSLKINDRDSFHDTFKKVLGSLTPDLNINKVCYTTRGYKLECKVIHKASELTEFQTYIIGPRVVINGLRYSDPIHYDHASYSICVLADDFVNDTGNSILFPICGYDITLDHYEGFTVDTPVVNVCVPFCKITSDRDGSSLSTKVPEITIRSDCGASLVIESARQQPCIGPRTNTGLSYGRWSIANYPWLEKLILDNVHVVCDNKTPNFSIGTYGIEDVPEIVLLNGATIECPEVHGTRIMRRSGFEGIYGSTKSDVAAEYDII